LRYLYPDGRVQAELPMYVVEETAERIVGWLPVGSEISYWALPDGSDPRTVGLSRRFRQHLTTARRHWQGGSVLRVIPVGECWQVLHFWDTATGQFRGWYVNLESPKSIVGDTITAVDWHLDLWISPSGAATWKDEDEAAAAAGTPYLRPDDLMAARQTGQAVLTDVAGFLRRVGQWTSFTPPDNWQPLTLPPTGP
jgi:hypothetical protein